MTTPALPRPPSPDMLPLPLPKEVCGTQRTFLPDPRLACCQICANRGPVQGRSSYPALAPESHLIAGLPRPRGSHSRCPAERDYRIVHPSVQEPCGEVLLCAAPLQRAGEPERPEKTPLPHLALPGLTSGLQEPLEGVC